MTDHERELLKWVAEELLGWTLCESPSRLKGTERWACILFEKPAQWYQIEETLESWHGLGLVVEEMEKGEWRLLKLGRDSDGDWWAIFMRGGFARYGRHDKPWFAVYEAARKAVGEVEEE